MNPLVSVSVERSAQKRPLCDGPMATPTSDAAHAKIDALTLRSRQTPQRLVLAANRPFSDQVMRSVDRECFINISSNHRRSFSFAIFLIIIFIILIFLIIIIFIFLNIIIFIFLVISFLIIFF